MKTYQIDLYIEPSNSGENPTVTVRSNVQADNANEAKESIFRWAKNTYGIESSVEVRGIKELKNRIW